MSKSIVLSIFDPRDHSEHSLSVEVKDVERLQLFQVNEAIYLKEDRFVTKKVVDKFYIAVKNVSEIFESFKLSDSIYIDEIKLIDCDEVKNFATAVDPSFTTEIKDDLLIFSQL